MLSVGKCGTQTMIFMNGLAGTLITGIMAQREQAAGPSVLLSEVP